MTARLTVETQSLARRLARRLKAKVAGTTEPVSKTAVLGSTVRPCVVCGGREAYVIDTVVKPDFDVALLPLPLRDAFLKKQNGYCATCGIFQDFNRLTAEDFHALNALGKDILTSDPTYHDYPPMRDAVIEFNRAHYGKRLDRWRNYFDHRPVSPKNILFLRAWFGAGPQFAVEYFRARVAGLDMSPVCQRYTTELLPEFQPLQGDINGLFEGQFLETGPYDAVFVFHVLAHAASAPTMLRQIRQLLKPGGFAIFTNEIERKPQNPFHNIHLSEPQLVALLRAEFTRVDRIDDCEDEFVPHASPYTLKHDVPDFAAWRNL